MVREGREERGEKDSDVLSSEMNFVVSYSNARPRMTNLLQFVVIVSSLGAARAYSTVRAQGSPSQMAR